MFELLSTKLFIPRPRKNLVSRPRLTVRLNAGLEKKLTLIAAPAGFGKTTLLSEWIPHSPRSVTWLSLDEDDNDPTKFWAYFITSLQALHPNLGDDALTLLQSPQAPSITSILTILINEIAACSDHFVIVLEDYHLVDSQPIHEALTYFLAHLPANLHLMMTTRVDPPLPLARLRARDKLTELRANDLRFTRDETATFLNQVVGVKLSEVEITTLEARTEGWVAGLQIAALSIQEHEDIPGFIQTFSGSHRHILGYLAEEVINQRPEGTLDFLLKTSILDRLSGPICDAVTGASGGQAILENLEHANLFITALDDENRWYRYHHLFAEVLQRRLRQSQSEWVPELYRRASEWFEEKGFNLEAIEYALRGGDWAQAIPLIEANLQSAQMRGEVTTVLRWLGALPDEAIHTRPTLGLTHAWLLVNVDEFSQAERRLATAEQALRSDPSPDAGGQAALLGQVAVVRETSALMQGYPGEVTIAAGREALALLPESDLARRAYALLILGCAQYVSLGDVRTAERSFEEAIRLSQSTGDAFTELITRAHLNLMCTIQGRLRAAEMPCDELMNLAGQPGWEHVPAAGVGRVMRAPILYERNDLQGALEALIQGIPELEGYSLKRPAIIGSVLLARLKLALGEWDEARELMERTWETIQKHHLKQIMVPAAAYRARMMLQMGDLDIVAQWANSLELPVDDPLNPALEYDYIMLARVRLAQGGLAEARQLLARLLPPAEGAGRMGRVIEILALQAVIAFAQQEKAHALAALERALILAETEGFVRTFLDEGEPMRLLLTDYHAILRKKMSAAGDNALYQILAYTEKLLAAFSQPVDLPAQTAATDIEPLSERELEILSFLSMGLSNKEIADRLIIATSTVKSHINNLYAKLGVHKRTQAVAIARDLGLLLE